MRDRLLTVALWACGLVTPLLLLAVGTCLLVGALGGGTPVADAVVGSGAAWGRAALGSLALVAVALIVAVPLGVGTAVWLEELAPRGPSVARLRAFIHGMSGVPGIAFGLAGAVLLLDLAALRPMILAAGLTLGVIALPGVVSRTEAALRTVPRVRREAARALGASPSQVLASVVLPSALPGIVSGGVLAAVRTLGETAALLVLGAAVLPDAPGTFAALPHHLLVLSRTADASLLQQAHLAALALVAVAVALRLAAWQVGQRVGVRS